jgi:hypothetical protein
LLTLPTSGQKISFNELLKLRDVRKPNVVNRRLAIKGYKMVSDANPTEGRSGIAIWGYKPSGTEAVAWVWFYYGIANGRYNVIRYQPDCNSTISYFEKKMKRLNMKVLEDEQLIEEKEKIYSLISYIGYRHVIRVLKQQQPHDLFTIEVYDKDYYKGLKEQGIL